MCQLGAHTTLTHPSARHPLVTMAQRSCHTLRTQNCRSGRKLRHALMLVRMMRSTKQTLLTRRILGSQFLPRLQATSSLLPTEQPSLNLRRCICNPKFWGGLALCTAGYCGGPKPSFPDAMWDCTRMAFLFRSMPSLPQITGGYWYRQCRLSAALGCACSRNIDTMGCPRALPILLARNNAVVSSVASTIAD